MDTTNDAAHVLVVDDEGAIRYSVSKTLQRIGYQVDEAASGEEALDLIGKREYEVILTDIRMPGVTGVELLKRIKDISADALLGKCGVHIYQGYEYGLGSIHLQVPILLLQQWLFSLPLPLVD